MSQDLYEYFHSLNNSTLRIFSLYEYFRSHATENVINFLFFVFDGVTPPGRVVRRDGVGCAAQRVRAIGGAVGPQGVHSAHYQVRSCAYTAGLPQAHLRSFEM